MMKSKLLVIGSVIFPILLLNINSAEAAIKAGSSCKKFGTATTYDNKIFTCVKSGKKLIWKVTMSLSTPTPTPSPTVSLNPINDMSANIEGSSVVYTFTSPNISNTNKVYELGLSHLISSSYDIKQYSSYSEVYVFKTVNSSPTSLTLTELKNFVASKSTIVNGISVMVRVREISGASKSNWGNGIYLTSEQINYIPTPVQSYAPTPQRTYTPAPTPTYGGGYGTVNRGLVGCTFNGKNLYGRVKIVDFLPDVTVKTVSFLPDIRVQKVDFLANSCGRWQFVDFLPDFTIKFVDFLPDITIQFVDFLPGARR